MRCTHAPAARRKLGGWKVLFFCLEPVTNWGSGRSSSPGSGWQGCGNFLPFSVARGTALFQEFSERAFPNFSPPFGGAGHWQCSHLFCVSLWQVLESSLCFGYGPLELSVTT